MGAPRAGGARGLARARGRERRDAARAPRARRARRRSRTSSSQGRSTAAASSARSSTGTRPCARFDPRAGRLRRCSSPRPGSSRRPRAGRVPGGLERRRRTSRVESLDDLDAEAVVVTAGPGRALLAHGIDLPVVETRETVLFFRLEREAGPSTVDDGRQALATASTRSTTRSTGSRSAATSRGRRPIPTTKAAPTGAIVDEVTEWAGATFSLAEPEPVEVETCFYTTTADEQLHPRAARPDRRRLGLLGPRVQVRAGGRRAARRRSRGGGRGLIAKASLTPRSDRRTVVVAPMRLVPGPAVRRLGVVGAVALVFTASGLAYICHPDLPGTRSLGIGGRVDAYALSGGRVTIHAWVRGCERHDRLETRGRNFVGGRLHAAAPRRLRRGETPATAGTASSWSPGAETLISPIDWLSTTPEPEPASTRGRWRPALLRSTSPAGWPCSRPRTASKGSPERRSLRAPRGQAPGRPSADRLVRCGLQ